MSNIFMIEFISLLAVSATWSQDTGVNHNISASSHSFLTSIVTTGRPPIIAVTRSVVAREGQDLNLMCSNKTWNEMIYTIWKINIDGSECQVSFDNQKELNTCNDGKQMHNSTRGESYLLIPQFSVRDQGVYHCESVYKGGINSQDITVTIIAPPEVKFQLEMIEGRRVAVCLVKGKPAASISWRNTWNSSITPQNTNDSNQVTSSLPLPEGVNTENLTCAVTHPFWNQEKMYLPTNETVEATQDTRPWLLVSISVVTITISVIMVTLGGLYFTRKHLCRIRAATPSVSKAPQPQDCVEEVEPYASYVQRVNSIYNSSAELFT
ncbi:cell surface glycoprotein CD200 receptor 1-A isoform X2 [Esox lucius]|uniref:cell surface glycoprotein CD200 receptor 1-A isoform X2 n=1 Tax=Esox lucius TaxID=8010 RepID=UPI000973308B|nr:cell surface glycoprotein CD200 receptor 1-A isoform X2 [Esox lucius]